jgi:alanine racemase
MRAEFRVDLGAISANIKTLKEQAGVPVLAVVKADAYGHGLIPVARCAIESGATWLGVALLEEALTIRAAGITAPTIAWLTPPGSDFESAINSDIDIAISSIKTFNEVKAASKKVGKKARIHIEIDTGMTRGGFLDEWKEFLQSDFTSVEVIGLFSHFARADEPGEKQNIDQLERFKVMANELESVGVKPFIKHLSNSAATLKDENSAFDLVRIGIAMYGLTPDLKHLGKSSDLGLRPAGQLRAQLHLVKKVPAGSPVGYGATAHTERQTRIGVVAMGYADGIPRIAISAGVTFKGKRAPILGRVSMDQFVVDLGADSIAQTGDWVTIFGDGKDGGYTADDWGSASQSINYEIVTRIGPRIPRNYGSHAH